MSSDTRFALCAGLIVPFVALAHATVAAAASAPLCVDASAPKAAVAAHHGRWIELSADQWQFLRGIYAMNPETPPGLPFGDHAVLARFDDISNGIVFFIDGDKACTPMTAPPELLSLMHDVATHRVKHEQPDF
jgi:hypothetical protein